MRLIHGGKAVVIGFLVVAGLTAFADANAKAAKEQARQGYSIFQGTIVDMSWPEIKKAAERNALVLLPIGVIEEHGPHMGLGADTYQAHALAKVLKAKLQSEKIEAVILPPMYWGIMQPNESGSYPGSLSVRPETMKAVLMDELTDVQTWGFKNIFIVSVHGDRVHRKTVDEVIPEAEKTLGIDIFNAHDGEGSGKPHPKINPFTVEKPFQPDYHSGAPETALMLAYFPEEVNTELAKTLKPQSTWQPLGYVGDPASFDKINTKVFETQIDYLKDNIVAWLTAKEKTAASAAK
jgi:creatinine amidohydrolase